VKDKANSYFKGREKKQVFGGWGGKKGRNEGNSALIAPIWRIESGVPTASGGGVATSKGKEKSMREKRFWADWFRGNEFASKSPSLISKLEKGGPSSEPGVKGGKNINSVTLGRGEKTRGGLGIIRSKNASSGQKGGQKDAGGLLGGGAKHLVLEFLGGPYVFEKKEKKYWGTFTMKIEGSECKEGSHGKVPPERKFVENKPLEGGKKRKCPQYQAS